MSEQYIDTINVGGTNYDIGCNCGKPVYSDDTGDYGFVYRLTADGEGLHKENATIKKFVGNSLVWNQMIINPQYSFTGGRTLQQFPVIEGHKYFVYTITSRPGGDGDFQVYFSQGGFTLYNSQLYPNGSIMTASTSGTEYLGTGVYSQFSGEEVTGSTICIDLTIMFGAGKEPNTAIEFKKLLTEPYYPYNAGTLINNRTKAIESVGFNLWDEEWEQGYIGFNGQNTVPGYYVNQIRSKNYIPIFPSTNYYFYVSKMVTFVVHGYDINKNYIGVIKYPNVPNGWNFTTQANCRYIRIASQTDEYGNKYLNDICINLSDTSRNGTYEPYKKYDLSINLNSFRVKDSNGNIITIEGGLKSAGSVYDEITSDGKYIKRIGSEILNGTETWSKPDGYNVYRTQNVVPNELNAICFITNVYDSVIGTNTVGSMPNKSAKSYGAYRQIDIKDDSYTNVDDFKAYLVSLNSSGKPLTIYYQLATPEVYDLVEVIPNNYPVDDLGTEARIAPLIDGVPGSPFKGDIDYYRSSDSYLHTVTVNDIPANVENGIAKVNLPDAQLKLKVGESTAPIFSSNATEDVRIELEAGDNVTLTPDFTAGKVTITADDTTYDVFTQTEDGLTPAYQNHSEDSVLTPEGWKNDGYFPQTHVGMSDTIVGNDVENTDTYVLRSTAGNTNGIDNDIESGYADITEINGNVVAWNLLVATYKVGDLGYGLTASLNLNGGLNISGTVTGLPSYGIIHITTSYVTLRRDRKTTYYIRLSNNNGVKCGVSGYTELSDPTASYSRIWKSNNTLSDWSNVCCIVVNDGDVINLTNLTINIINLSLIYGLGNEPTSVEQVEADLAKLIPQKPYYQYNPGELIGTKKVHVISYGQNLLNPGTCKARLVPYTYGSVTNQYGILAQNNTTFTATFTPDATGVATAVSPNSNGIFSITGKGTLDVTVAGNPEDICVWTVWDGSNNGEYKPYNADSVEIDTTLIYGKLNGSGSMVLVFPDGMKATGFKSADIRDVIDVENSNAVVNVGSADLGNLNWSNYNNIYFYAPLANFKFQDDWYKNINCICTKYAAMSGGNSEQGMTGVFSNNGASNPFRIKDVEHATMGGSQFAELVDGAMLWYELATPLQYTNIKIKKGGKYYDLPSTIAVDNYGIEEQVLTSSDKDFESVSATITSVYQSNVADQIDSLPNEYASLQTIKSKVDNNKDEYFLGTSAVAELAYTLVGLEFDNTDSYIIRPTAGNENGVDNEVENGYAEISKIEGNGLAWNLWMRSPSSNISETKNGVTFVDNRDGSYTISTDANGATAMTTFDFRGGYPAVGHKWFITGIQNANGCSIVDSFSWSIGNVTNPTIVTMGEYAYCNYAIRVQSGIVLTTPVTIRPQFIDLSLIYGLGNEPTSVEQVEKDLQSLIAQKPYYQYNSGELYGTKKLHIVSYGLNLLNPSTSQARLVSYEYGDNSNKYGIAFKEGATGTITFTPDSTGVSETISPDNTTGIFSISGKGAGTLNVTMTSGSSASDVYVWAVYDGAKDGINNYVPFQQDAIEIKAGEIYGKLNGTGEYVKVFADDVMRGAGSTHDLIDLQSMTADVKVSNIDLGSLTWTKRSEVAVGRFSSEGITDYKSIDAVTCLCGKYTSLVNSNGYSHTDVNKSVYMYWNPENPSGRAVYITDSSYENTSAGDFKTEMSDVLLWYELATPKHYTDLKLSTDGETFRELPKSFAVDNWGIEEQIPSETIPEGKDFEGISATVTATYQQNVTEQIGSLPTSYATLATLKGKADKVLNSTSGNIATVTGDGNYEDSGVAINSIKGGMHFVGITSTDISTDIDDPEITIVPQSGDPYTYTAVNGDVVITYPDGDKFMWSEDTGTWHEFSSGQIPTVNDNKLKLQIGTDTPVLIFSANASSDSTVTLTAGNNVSLSLSDNNVTISATDTTYSDFGASGNNHSSGLVPDPGSTAGTSKYLCEDGSWKEVSTTDTTYKLTVNGTVNGDLSGTSLGTIYTPTSYGTTGLFLKSNGDNNAPTWDTPTDTTYSAGSNISITGNSNAINALGYSWTSSNSTFAVTGQVNASVGFFQTSDIRKKEIVGDLDLNKAYDLIDKCQTIIYTLKDNDQKQVGLIAQEVKEFFPEIISEDESGMLSLDYSRLTVVILKVLKDLINRVSKLENYVKKR